jgi:MerR family transcriptional regulator, light-induced transcriptional regulator
MREENANTSPTATAKELVEQAAPSLVSATAAQVLALTPPKSLAPPKPTSVTQQVEEHLAAVVAALGSGDPRSFTAYVQSLAAESGVSENLVTAVEVLAQAIRQQLGEPVWSHTRAVLDPALEWLTSQAGPDTLLPIVGAGDILQDYTQSILKGDRIQAQKLVFGALEQGQSIRDIYLKVVQPSLYEVGRLWEVGQVSIAQEHLATAITQSVLATIYAQVELPSSLEQHAVVACLEGNFHEIGPRMLADFLQMAGYNTRFLGTNSSADCVIEVIEAVKPSVVGFPATTRDQVDAVKSTIERVRADFTRYRPTIMVGGLAFNLVDGLWKAVEADLWKEDGGQAVDELVGSSDWAERV